MRPRTRLTLLAVALLLASPALATPVSDRFSNHGSTQLQGEHDLTWRTALVSIATETGRPLRLELEDADLALTNVPIEVLRVHVPDVDRTQVRRPLDEETRRLEGHDGTVHVDLGPGGDARLVCPGALDWPLRTRGADATVAPAGSRIVTGESPYRLTGSVDGVDVFPAIPHTVATADGPPHHRVDGCALVATGGVARLPGEAPRALGTWLNASRSAFDPATGTGRYVYDSWFLVVRVHEGTLHAPGAWRLAARSVHGDVSGRVTWNGLATPVSINTTTHHPHVLDLDGTVALGATLTGREALWAVEGDATNVYVDRELVWASERDVAVGVGVLGVGALLLALLRSVATLLLGRSTPAAVRVPALGHPRRRRILQAIHEHQPVRLPDLQGLTGIPRGALRYHLRVLTSADVLQTHERRRNTTYMLNSGSLMFQAGDGAPKVGLALSVAHSSPVRQALHDHLTGHGPATADELREHLAATGRAPARSTMTYHLKLLTEAGLVAVEQRGSRKTYRATIDPRSVQAEQYARYLRQERALPLVALLAQHGAVPRAEAREHLRGAGHGAAERVLDRLLCLALLESDGDALRLAAPLAPLAHDIVARGAA